MTPTQENNNFVIGSQVLKTIDLEKNTGQISGVPENPRYIDEKGLKDLKNSISEDPEFLNARPLIVIPYGPFYVVLAGNMRLTACVELNIIEVPCLILNPNTPVEKLKAFVIKDNVSYGKNDWDLMANEWDQVQLQHWGVDLPFLEEVPEEKGETEEIEQYKITLDCGTDEPAYNLLKLKIANLIEKEKFRVEMRG